MILDSNKRPEIDYPCEWSYKVIGNNIDKMLEVIESAVSGLKYDVTPSNISKNGNYYSLNLTLTVPNEVVRDLIYQKLDISEFVKIVF
jgi:putative lipoic acid-binding regulatory protein